MSEGESTMWFLNDLVIRMILLSQGLFVKNKKDEKQSSLF